MTTVLRACLVAMVVLANMIPCAVMAQELDDGSDWLLQVVPLVTAAKVAKYNACMNELRPGCESTFDYCMMSVEEKLNYALKLCYDQKVTCYSACEDAYQKCCAASGLSECPPECRTKKTDCMALCDREGDQCVLDAINENYEPPVEAECQNDLDECLENAKEICRDIAEAP
jgi:hypothetical protein